MEKISGGGGGRTPTAWRHKSLGVAMEMTGGVVGFGKRDFGFFAGGVIWYFSFYIFI